MRWKKKEEKREKEAEETLLQELCGADAGLYGCLSCYLYANPLAAIPEEDLDVLTKEAEATGSFRPALDKAIFEGARNPGEREKYVRVIENLSSKAIRVMEQEQEATEKKGLTKQAASLGRRIENQRFMSERAGDILEVASTFYNEKLLELGEDSRREARKEARKTAEREEKRTEELERAGREGRRKARRGMGKRERREAREQDKREELAAEEERKTRGEERREAEREEKRTEELEKAGREARKEERQRD